MVMMFSIRPCRSGNFLLFCLVLIACNTVYAAQPDVPQAAQPVSSRFYQQSKQGWFWYEDPIPEQAEKREERTEQPTPRRLPSLDQYSIDTLWNMYPDDFQELLDVLQKKAVQYPTENNIMEYLTMQDIARRKALAYTNAAMYVTQKRGELFSVNHVYPTSGPGITARIRMQRDEISSTIRRAGENHALIFFVRQGCGFCEKQARILAYFRDKYGWPIRTVDIGRNIDAATRFDITITPTLLLITKGEKKYMTVSSGVIALSELERKLYRAIRYLQGNTGQDNFLIYDFQKGSALDPTSILRRGKQPWKDTN